MGWPSQPQWQQKKESRQLLQQLQLQWSHRYGADLVFRRGSRAVVKMHDHGQPEGNFSREEGYLHDRRDIGRGWHGVRFGLAHHGHRNGDLAEGHRQAGKEAIR